VIRALGNLATAISWMLVLVLLPFVAKIGEGVLLAIGFFAVARVLGVF